MKKIKNVCLTGSILFLLNSIQVKADSQLWLGVDYQKFSYAEDVTPPNKSTESATFPAAMLKYRYYWSELSNMQFSYSNASSVKSTYDGSDLNSGAPITAENPLKFTKYELKFDLHAFDSLVFFAGAGQKIWDRFLTGGSGYREIYSWLYFPVGFRYILTDSMDFMAGVELSTLLMSGGKIKIITSETVSGGADSEIDLGSKAGYRIAFPMQWLGSSFGFEFSPYAEQTEIGKSDMVTNTTLAPNPGAGIYEPASKTIIYGVETGLIVKF